MRKIFHLKTIKAQKRDPRRPNRKGEEEKTFHSLDSFVTEFVIANMRSKNLSHILVCFLFCGKYVMVILICISLAVERFKDFNKNKKYKYKDYRNLYFFMSAIFAPHIRKILNDIFIFVIGWDFFSFSKAPCWRWR